MASSIPFRRLSEGGILVDVLGGVQGRRTNHRVEDPGRSRYHRVMGLNEAKDPSLDLSEERNLVDALQAGDDSAFESVVRRYGGALLAVARRLLGNEEDAREALQDALLSAFRAMGTFQSSARLSTWLHRIVINSALMKLRKRARRDEQSIEPLLPEFLDDGHPVRPAAPWRMSPESIVQNEEMRAKVRECISRLPENYRIVLQLRDIEELDTRETAELLGIDQNVMKVRLHRARQALRTLLDPYFSENPE
jgi:RNA polymerase sigma-70 factor (ECF subfamily)